MFYVFIIIIITKYKYCKNSIIKYILKWTLIIL